MSSLGERRGHGNSKIDGAHMMTTRRDAVDDDERASAGAFQSELALCRNQG